MEPARNTLKRQVALSAHRITKNFREGPESITVLRGVSLSLNRGEVLGLEGPSGSGKTTLLSILGCILTPTQGNLEIDGEAVDPLKPERLPALRRRSIGFVFQQYNLFPALSALENVEFALNVKGQKGKEATREAQRLLDQVGLGNRLHYLPQDLSGGQKQRVAIARAMTGSPTVLLADEPTANLDRSTGAQVLHLFREQTKKENRALLVVTHDPVVRGICDRVLRLRDGLFLP